MTVVVIRIHREHADIDATIAVDGDGKVAGLHYAPAAEPAAAAPPVDADAAYVETDFTVGSGERALPGTLAMPKRSEEHTSELQSLMRISYAVFCLKKKKN